MNIHIAPSLLSADFSDLKNEVINIEKAGATHLHLDVMDGAFVPNITFGKDVISAIRKHTKLIFDIHMMVENPERYIKDMVDAGANSITIHAESTKHLDRAINLIKSYGVKACVALNPATPISVLENVAYLLDMILVMSVNPGFGGQKFIPQALDKIQKLRELYPDIDIEVDGGINDKTAKLAKTAGANILVAGSYVFGGDYKQRIESLK
ncbi:ribulose-phosphate 3-epimerase [Sneathia sp. DSM 16631]|uniref:ribulose-phosphate 3-epimerase n=1 Tax=Sneathia TaxID=168808 RepID=UPI001865DE43|nr:MULTISPECIES: ribulose-phosphate 3-epimerase [Sneathia]MBE3031255.1 ribulose-phosphate 3-epimerase [Sneathia sp. DSM 16631]MDK9581483.1 ribulose-phosphate 3-epimerase [Sneathia vaginalis]